ncbi:sodium/glucose cotransporter 5 [Ixodes scapularis]
MSAVNSRNAFGKINLEPWDIVVVVTYFVAVIAVGIWSSWRSSRGSMSGYFLASRSMHWIPVGASLFASNIGSGHFVGLAGSGAASGIGIAGFELNALFVLILLGWFFVPVYVASGVYTMPEYLRKRFGGQRIRIYLSVLALLLSIFTKISADLFAGAIFIKQALGWNLYLSVCALLIVACLFTVAGGLSAVIWTDFVQTVLIVIGAFALMIMSLVEVGGYDQLMKAFATAEPTNASYARYTATNESCSRVPDNYNHLLRSPLDSELPWTGMVFGSVVCAIWYWCSDQVIVQRALSAKNMVHAKAGCVMAGYLKLLPMYLLVIPGMAARVLFPDLVACSSPERCREVCDNENGCTNIAYPLLVVKLMPVGARGMMLSVMLAALMSSLTSIFNSSSTIFTIDIWKKFRKNASEMELLIVGRTFVVVLVGVSIIWIPIIEVFPSSQLFHYIQGVTSYLAPPVCAVYVLAVSWKRINEPGAFWGLMIGLAAGMSRFIWEFSYHVPGCGSPDPDPRPAIISSVHYLHFAVLLFLISVIATVVISLLTPPIDDKKARFNPNLVACSSPERCREVCDNENGCTNIAYPLLVVKLMPVGARGMMLSVMLAALMSSLTSIFNSSSTIFTIDIWKKFRKNASEMELLIVGRTFVVVLVGVSIIWIPIIEVFPSSQLFHYIQGVTSYLAPPVCAVYVLAVSWKRINEPGAFWGLMIGLAAGMSRFIWEFSYHVPGCGSPDPDPRPAIISSVHYLHFAVLLFLISVIATVVISLLTPPIDDKKLYRLTYATRKSTAIREDLDRPRIKSVSQVNGVYNGTDNVSYTKSSENLANDIPMTTLRHSSPHESIRPTHKEVSGLKRALFCICGVTSTQQKAEAEAANPLPRLSPAEEAHEAARSLEEHPLWGKVCNVNAVVLLVVASFVLGFYA